MNNNIYTAIDIGSKNLKIISMDHDPETGKTKILSKNSYPIQGVSHGYISNPNNFNTLFSKIIEKYERETGFKIDEVILTIDPLGLESKKFKILHNTVNQSSVSDMDISEIERKINLLAQKNISGEILNHHPIKYTINNFDYYNDIKNLNAKKIEVEYLYTFLPENHLTTIEKIFFKNNIEIIDILSGSIISSETHISNEDKNLGVINVDIGAHKTALVVWENDKIIFTKTVNFGSDDVTKDISLKKKIPFSEAEKIKKDSRKWDKDIEKSIKDNYTKWAERIKKELENLKLNELLPGGIILSGGGSKDEKLIDILKSILKIPIKKYEKTISNQETEFHNPYSAIISKIKQSKKKSINFKKGFNKLKNFLSL